MRSTLENHLATVQPRYNIIPALNNTFLSRNKVANTHSYTQQEKMPLQPTVFQLPNGIFT
jgi:hypothetical protein